MFEIIKVPEAQYYAIIFIDNNEEATEYIVDENFVSELERNPYHDIEIINNQPVIFISGKKQIEAEKSTKINELKRLDKILDEYSFKIDKYEKMQDGIVKDEIILEFSKQAKLLEDKAMQLMGELIQVYGLTPRDIAEIVGSSIGDVKI